LKPKVRILTNPKCLTDHIGLLLSSEPFTTNTPLTIFGTNRDDLGRLIRIIFNEEFRVVWALKLRHLMSGTGTDKEYIHTRCIGKFPG
jgi:hypothetical protein